MSNKIYIQCIPHSKPIQFISDSYPTRLGSICSEEEFKQTIQSINAARIRPTRANQLSQCLVVVFLLWFLVTVMWLDPEQSEPPLAAQIMISIVCVLLAVWALYESVQLVKDLRQRKLLFAQLVLTLDVLSVQIVPMHDYGISTNCKWIRQCDPDNLVIEPFPAR